MAHEHSDPKYLYDKYLEATPRPMSYWEIWCAAIDANEELLNAVRAHRDNLMKMLDAAQQSDAATEGKS